MLPGLRQLTTGDGTQMVTGMSRYQPASEDAFARRNRLHANVAATVSGNDEYYAEEEMSQENMSQYHCSRYDNCLAETIPSLCFVTAQQELEMAANPRHHDKVSVQNVMTL